MRRNQALPGLSLGLRVALLAMTAIMAIMAIMAAGCAGPSTAQKTPGAGQATPTATATLPPTATPRPKPTTPPAITKDFCQRVMSVDQANQITHPPRPATTIRVQSAASGGGCSYEYAPGQATISLLFAPYPGGALQTLASQALSASLLNAKVSALEPVSGLGDQAYFGVATSTLNLGGATITEKEQALYVVYGGVVFAISAVVANGAGGIGSVPDTQALADFQRIAALVLAQL